MPGGTVAVRYEQTVIAVAWAVVRPFLTMVVLIVVFGRLILAVGQRMSQMVDDVLTVVRLEAGDRRLTCEDVDLCRGAVAMKIRLAPFEPPRSVRVATYGAGLHCIPIAQPSACYDAQSSSRLLSQASRSGCG